MYVFLSQMKKTKIKKTKKQVNETTTTKKIQ